jgi:hypothetical protein
MMSRKDYIGVADILNLFRDEIPMNTLEDLISEFSDFFLADNKNFNSKKFAEAILAKEVK